MIALLLDRGAEIDATDDRGSQALDLAVWSRRAVAPASGAFDTARLLLSRGAICDLTIAAALGDRHRVTALVDQNPACLREVRQNGKRALSAAVKFGHREIARLLLERGADPNWPNPTPRGALPYTPPPASVTTSWWSCCSRTVPIPTAMWTRGAMPFMQRRLPNCGRC